MQATQRKSTWVPGEVRTYSVPTAGGLGLPRRLGGSLSSPVVSAGRDPSFTQEVETNSFLGQGRP